MYIYDQLTINNNQLSEGSKQPKTYMARYWGGIDNVWHVEIVDD